MGQRAVDKRVAEVTEEIIKASESVLLAPGGSVVITAEVLAARIASPFVSPGDIVLLGVVDAAVRGDENRPNLTVNGKPCYAHPVSASFIDDYGCILPPVDEWEEDSDVADKKKHVSIRSFVALGRGNRTAGIRVVLDPDDRLHRLYVEHIGRSAEGQATKAVDVGANGADKLRIVAAASGTSALPATQLKLPG